MTRIIVHTSLDELGIKLLRDFGMLLSCLFFRLYLLFRNAKAHLVLSLNSLISLPEKISLIAAMRMLFSYPSSK